MFFSRYFTFIFLFFGLSLTSACLQAGELVLDNGDRIEGEIQRIEADKVVWISDNLGRVELPKKKIVEMVSSVPLKLQGRRGVCYWAGLENRTAKLDCEQGGSLALSFLELKEAVLFDDYRRRTYAYNGSLRGTASPEESQIHKRDWNIDFGIKLRHTDWRHDVSYKYTAESYDDGPLLQRNEPRYQLDWFVAPKTYWTMSAGALQDDLRLVDKRITVGVGLGYQFWEMQRSALAFETGPQYLKEVLSDATEPEQKINSEYGSWRLAMDGRVLLPFDVKLFSKIEYLQSITGNNHWVLKSDSGLTMPIAKGITAEVSFIYNYDNTPQPGVRDLDSRLRFGLGYQW